MKLPWLVVLLFAVLGSGSAAEASDKTPVSQKSTRNTASKLSAANPATEDEEERAISLSSLNYAGNTLITLTKNNAYNLNFNSTQTTAVATLGNVALILGSLFVLGKLPASNLQTASRFRKRRLPLQNLKLSKKNRRKKPRKSLKKKRRPLFTLKKQLNNQKRNRVKQFTFRKRAHGYVDSPAVRQVNPGVPRLPNHLHLGQPPHGFRSLPSEAAPATHGAQKPSPKLINAKPIRPAEAQYDELYDYNVYEDDLPVGARKGPMEDEDVELDESLQDDVPIWVTKHAFTTPVPRMRPTIAKTRSSVALPESTTMKPTPVTSNPLTSTASGSRSTTERADQNGLPYNPDGGSFRRQVKPARVLPAVTEASRLGLEGGEGLKQRRQSPPSRSTTQPLPSAEPPSSQVDLDRPGKTDQYDSYWSDQPNLNHGPPGFPARSGFGVAFDKRPRDSSSSDAGSRQGMLKPFDGFDQLSKEFDVDNKELIATISKAFDDFSDFKRIDKTPRQG